MPELPEVEHLRQTLVPLVVGRRVRRVRLVRRDVVIRPGDPAGGFSRSGLVPATHTVPARELLSGQRITEILRHGKQLAIIADSGRVLCVHLGMTGRLLHLPARAHRPDHVHAVWTLDDGSRVLFRDPRRFGGLWIFSGLEELRGARWSALGPDALTITSHALRSALGRTRRGVKAALLDQRVLAGVGNIYADEALFDASLHPARRADGIGSDGCVRLARAIRTVLRRATDAGGSTLRDYADARGAPGAFQRRHRVYGRAGLPCARCGTPLESALLAQRGTTWCPTCQPLGSPLTIPTNPETISRERPLSLHEERIFSSSSPLV